MGIITYAEKVSLVLGGRLSIKPSLIQRCFSSLQASPSGGTTRPLSASPWLMVPPTLVADHDESDVKHCRKCNIVRSPTFKVKRNSQVKPEDNNYYHFLNIADNKIDFKKEKKDIWLPWNNDYFSPDESICIGSSHGWLAYIHPHNCTPYLYNPFSDSSMPYLPLPPVETLRHIHSSRRHNLTHIDNSSSSIDTEFKIRGMGVDEEYFTESGIKLSKLLFRKVVMSRAPNEYTDCTVMAIYHDRACSYGQEKLAFCRIGDSSWTVLDSPSCSYHDIAYVSKENRFYAACSETYGEGWLECWDLTDPSSPQRDTLCRDEPANYYLPITENIWVKEACYRAFYLVESSKELLTVIRYYQYSHDKMVTKAFDVFKVGNYEGWTYVPNIGDRTLFVGGLHSVSLPARDFPGLKKKCIYFTAQDNDGNYIYFNRNKSTELGVYNFQGDRMEYSFQLEGTEPSPVWVTSHH